MQIGTVICLSTISHRPYQVAKTFSTHFLAGLLTYFVAFIVECRHYGNRGCGVFKGGIQN